MRSKRIIGIVIIVLLVLFIPFIAMQFTNEVNWGLEDFIVGGILLFGTGILVEITLSRVRKLYMRVILIASIIILLLFIWIQLAVGIF